MATRGDSPARRAVLAGTPGAAGSGSLRPAVTGGVLGKAAEMGTLVLLAIVVPRSLGPADYGSFALSLTVVTIGSLVLTLGGPTLVTRYVPAAPPSQRPALARALGARLARGRAGQLAVVTALAAAAVAWDPARFPPLETALIVAALALNVAATVLLLVPLGLALSGGWNARYPVQNAALVALALWLHATSGARGAQAAIVLAALVGVAVAAVAVAPLRRVEASVPAVVPDGAMRFGALQGSGAALTQLTHRGGVVVVAVVIGSSAETGFAALAVGVALAATYAVLHTFTVALPHVAPLDGTAPDPAGARRAEGTLRRLAAGLLAVVLPACAASALVLDAVVPAVFGAGYAPAVPAFGPALAVVVIAPLYALAVQVAALRLCPGAALVSGAVSAVVFLLVALAAVPARGAAGATAAVLAGVAAGCAVFVRVLPGAAGRPLCAMSFGGSAAVLVLASVP